MKGGPGGFHDDQDLADLLNHMFGAGVGGFPGMGGMGGMGGGAGGTGRRSKNAVQEFEVSLEDLYKGKHVKMMSKRKIVCTSCKGYTPSVTFIVFLFGLRLTGQEWWEARDETQKVSCLQWHRPKSHGGHV